MTQVVQTINNGVETGDIHDTKSLKKKTKSAASKVNSSRFNLEPDKAFSKTFLLSRGSIPADVELGFR